MAKEYLPIPSLGKGGQGNIVVKTRLYTAADHLLIVTQTGYTETYKRVFFKDIRYVIVQETNGLIWQGFISAGLMFLVLSLGFFGVPFYFTMIFNAPFLFWFMLNLWRGQACVCHVNTEVQTLKLPVPKRVNKVPVLLAFLREKSPDFNPSANEVPATNP